MDFCWRHRRGVLDLRRQGVIMGVLNITPDSFSDGGRYYEPAAAVAHALAMVEAGAAIIDVGGESTRPGADRVSAAEQRRRTVPVIKRLRHECDALISVDTTLAEVAEAAIEAGADIVNDISGLTGDARMATVCAHGQVGVVVMHMQGEPRTMQNAPVYQDVVAEVKAFFAGRAVEAAAAGLDPGALVFDPGIGFGKTVAHNLSLIRATGHLSPLPGRPVMLGVSRKSFISKVLGTEMATDRDWATVALTSLGREMGARIFRVHDVKPNVHSLRMTEAILEMESEERVRGPA